MHIRSNGPDGIGPASNINSSCNGSDDEENSGAFWERVLSIHQHQGGVLKLSNETIYMLGQVGRKWVSNWTEDKVVMFTNPLPGQ